MQGRNFWLALLGALLLVSRAAWCDELPAAPSDEQNPWAWVAQLNDDDYAVREAAAEKLTKAGSAAIAALVEGVTSDQAEVAWRCGAALEQIGLEGDEQTIDQIVRHLDAARAKSGRGGLKSLATDLYARQKQFRRERAITQIRKHGGQVAGSGIDGGMDAMMMPGVFIGPAVVFDGPVMEMDVAGVALPAPAMDVEVLPHAEPLGLFAEIGRAIGRAIAPGGGVPAADPMPEDAKVDAAKAAEEAAVEVKRAADEAIRELEKVERAVEEVSKDAKKDLEAPAKEKPEKERADEPPPEVEVKVREEVLLEPAGVALADIAVAEVAMAADAGFAVEGGWAQLVLDQNWRGGDEGLAVLKDLPELAAIELRQTKLTDKALDHLTRLANLRQLNLYQSGLSRDALLKFHRQRASVVIYARGEAMLGVNADFSTSPLVLTSIYGGSGAADAGLQAGDVIHQIDGVKIRDFSELTICVSAKKPGDKIDVEFERSGKKQSAEVTLKPRAIDQ